MKTNWQGRQPLSLKEHLLGAGKDKQIITLYFEHIAALAAGVPGVPVPGVPNVAANPFITATATTADVEQFPPDVQMAKI